MSDVHAPIYTLNLQPRPTESFDMLFQKFIFLVWTRVLECHMQFKIRFKILTVRSIKLDQMLTKCQKILKIRELIANRISYDAISYCISYMILIYLVIFVQQICLTSHYKVYVGI